MTLFLHAGVEWDGDKMINIFITIMEFGAKVKPLRSVKFNPDGPSSSSCSCFPATCLSYSKEFIIPIL